MCGQCTVARVPGGRCSVTDRSRSAGGAMSGSGTGRGEVTRLLPDREVVQCIYGNGPGAAAQIMAQCRRRGEAGGVAQCTPGVQCNAERVAQVPGGEFGPGAARPPVGPYIAAHAIFFRNLHCNLIGRLHPRSPLYLPGGAFVHEQVKLVTLSYPKIFSPPTRALSPPPRAATCTRVTWQATGPAGHCPRWCARRPRRVPASPTDRPMVLCPRS